MLGPKLVLADQGTVATRRFHPFPMHRSPSVSLVDRILAADSGANDPTLAGRFAFNDSWPLTERSRHFDLGMILNCAVIDAVEPSHAGDLAVHHAACWECDLADNSLTWSGGVYDIFGLPRGCVVSRDDAVALYCEESRAIMERLRADAIRQRRGFTLDAEIRPVTGGRRWIRLIAAPECERGRTMRLHGLKLII